MTPSEVGRGGIETSKTRKGTTTRGGKREKKEKNRTWMKGEKSWPHSQIKLHPNFKGPAVEAGNY